MPIQHAIYVLYLLAGGVLLFAQFAVAPGWLTSTYGYPHPGMDGPVLLVIGGVLAALAALFWIGSEANPEPPDYGKVKEARKRLFMVLLAVVAAMVAWCVWILPVSTRHMNAHGPEPAHLEAAASFSSYLRGKQEAMPLEAELSPRDHPVPAYLCWLPLSGGLIRFPQLLFLLSTVVAGSWAATLILDRAHTGLAFTLLLAGSPLLHAFTANVYPQLMGVSLSIVACAGLYAALVQGHRHGLALAAMSAALLPLVQLNFMCTSVLIALGLLFTGFRQPRRAFIIRGILAAVIALLPGLLYLQLLSPFGTLSDAFAFRAINTAWLGRFALYLPWMLPALAGLAFIRGMLPIVATALVGIIILVQALLHQMGVNDPAWSGNFLALLGPCFVLGLISLRQVLDRFPYSQPRWVLLLFFFVAGQLALGSFELKRNRLFHEHDTWLDLPAVVRAAETDYTGTVYMGSAFADRDSFLLPPPIHPYAKDYRLHRGRDWQGGKALEDLKPGERYVVYYFSYPWIVFKNQILHKDRPGPGELQHFQVLAEVTDPLSDGRTGVLVLEKQDPATVEPSEP